VQIEGHTDNINDEAYNQLISQRRADSVKWYLIKFHRIPARRMVATGYGSSRPRVENDTPEGREKNRRVEIVKLNVTHAVVP
jgi:OOP family OmpA-OmpF porin